jgi:hypothetical protein
MGTLGSQKPKDDPGAMTFIAQTPVTICFMMSVFGQSSLDVLMALDTPGITPHVVIEERLLTAFVNIMTTVARHFPGLITLAH